MFRSPKQPTYYTVNVESIRRVHQCPLRKVSYRRKTANRKTEEETLWKEKNLAKGWYWEVSE